MPVVTLEISNADGSLLSRGVIFIWVVTIESEYGRTETVD